MVIKVELVNLYWYFRIFICCCIHFRGNTRMLWFTSATTYLTVSTTLLCPATDVIPEH